MPELYRHFKLTIKAITNLHIGSGESLDPTQYVLQDSRLWHLNQPVFIRNLSQKNPQALQMLLQADFKSMLRIIRDLFDPSDLSSFLQIHPCSKEQEEEYNANLNRPDSQQLILEFIANRLTGNPYIPGSSLKGAVRTAWIAHLLTLGKVAVAKSGPMVVDRDMEPKLLDYMNDRGRPDITLDPFKYLKLADAEFPASSLCLKLVKNQKSLPAALARNSSSDLQYYCQAMDRAAPPVSGTLSLHQNWNQSPEDLFNACNSYYYGKLKADAPFYTTEIGKKNYQAIMDYLKPNPAVPSFILKLGKATGSVFTSINLQTPKTRNLIGGIPMGWVKILYEELT